MSLRLLYLFICLLVAASVCARPSIRFEQHAVIASDVRAGATVIWLGYTHGIRDTYYSRTTEYAMPVRDTDNDGTVRLDVPEGVAPASIWVAVDLTNGNFSVASPEEAVKVRHFGGGVFQGPADGASARFLHEEESITFLLVRPGVGAWVGISNDGAPSDPDRDDDGVVGVVLATMEPIFGGSPAPAEVRRDDVLIGLSAGSRSVFETRFAR